MDKVTDHFPIRRNAAFRGCKLCGLIGGLPALRPICALIAALAAVWPVAAPAQWVWEESHAPPATFRAIQAVNSNVVWVAGTGGTCRRTVDGGATWQIINVTNAVRLDFRGLYAFDASAVVLMSSGEASQGLTKIYRTEDAGQTWKVVFDTDQKGVFLDGVSFWDRNNGLAVGDSIEGKWYLLQTHDGGQTWERVPPASLPDMLPGEGAFAAGNTSMAMRGADAVWLASGAAARARIFISKDRAKTWSVYETPMPAGETAGIYSLRVLDEKRAIAVGGDYKQDHTASDNVILSDDGGMTWRKGGRTDPPGLKETVIALPGNLLLAIGPSGTSRSRDFGNSWEKVDEVRLHAASCKDGSCWAVGDKGRIGKWKQE